MKKYVLILIIIILMVLSIIFIPVKHKEEKETLVFWTLQLGTFDKYINGIIEEYEKENPGIKIKWVDVPYSEGEKRTLASVLTDNPPDIINLTPDFSMLLAQKNALYEIDEKYLSQYTDGICNLLKYNNKYFGIPFYATSAVTLVNKQLVKEYNLNKLPIEYKDLFKIKKLNNSSYVTMINLSENDTLLKILNKYNINSPSSINSPESISLFKEFKKAYDEGLIPKESITQNHREALEKYMSGQLMFLVTGSNFINMIKENAYNVYKTTDIIPQLTGDTGLYDYSLMNFIIPKKAQHKEAALKFILFFTNKANQTELTKLTTILPANKEALDLIFNKSITNIEDKAIIQSAKQLNKLQPPISNVKNKKELNTLSSNYIQEILIKNGSVKDTLDKFSEDWSKL